MRIAPPRTTKIPSPGKWNGNREAHRADCVRIVHAIQLWPSADRPPPGTIM
jgi:hypothetical protein